MNINKPKDERIISEYGRLYRICFYILYGGILLDVILKFNFYSFSETTTQTIQLFITEIILLISVFYITLFSLAKKGILFFFENVEPTKFPRKKYILLSVSVSATLALSLWTLRIIMDPTWIYGWLSGLLFLSAIYLITFTLSFIFLYLSFYLSYRVAKKNYAKIIG